MFPLDEIEEVSNPYDFRQWVKIMKQIDLKDSGAISGDEYQKYDSLYQQFLSVFPWLHKYWTKYALFVWNAKQDLTLIREIYRNALSRSKLMYSVEMWREYINFFQINLPATDKATIKEIYAEALDAIGAHFNSSEIWNIVLNFEAENQVSRFLLLAKAISNPISELKRFWSELQTLISRVPSRILHQFDPSRSVRELLFFQDRPEPHNYPPTREMEILKSVSEKLTKLYHESLEQLSKSYKYISNISRYYFLFESPDDIQIGNWEQYAEMLEDEFREKLTKQSFDAVVHCYECALIPCAFISSIWISYANFIEDAAVSNSQSNQYATIDDCRSIYQRIPFNVIPQAKSIYAEFEEQYYPASAAQIYLEMSQSQYAEQVVSSVYFTLRTQGLDAAAHLLRTSIKRFVEGGNEVASSVLAAALLDLCNETSDNVNGSVYLSEYANKLVSNDPQAANTALYDLCYNNTHLKLDDKLVLLQIYMDYAMVNGVKSDFQLQLQKTFDEKKNKLIFNQDFFNQQFLISKQPTELKKKLWIENLSE